jgi:triacylglycerol lipase
MIRSQRPLETDPWPQPSWSPTRYPLVLMHGFGALAGLTGGVFRREALHLRARGVAAFAPAVSPYGTLDERADDWDAHLARVVVETGAERVNLLAFSSGGLDARLLAQRPAWAGRVASLVTLSTPHRGNPLAAWALDRPDRLTRVVVGAMDVVGGAAWPAPPRVADALAGLTPDAVAARFPPDETIDDAWCASYVSRAGIGTRAPMHPALQVPHRVLHRLAGANDGIVPTASMAWGEPLGTVEADHARQVGITVTPSRLYRSTAFVAAHADRLRARGL